MPIRAEGAAAAQGDIGDRFQHALAQLRRTWTPGTLTGDANRFLNAVDGVPVPDVWLGGWESLDPWRAAAALARHRRFLPTWPADPQAKGHMCRLIRELGRQGAERHLREVLYPEALMFAAKGLDQPQRIRFKNGGFLKDAGGRALPFKPETLALATFARWLRKAAIRHIVLRLAESDSIVRPERVPAFYGRRSPAGQFFGRLSPEERTLIRLHDGGGSHAEVAEALDISTSAARQRAYRLRRKLEGR
jgi:hypothetical protein